MLAGTLSFLPGYVSRTKKLAGPCRVEVVATEEKAAWACKSTQHIGH